MKKGACQAPNLTHALILSVLAHPQHRPIIPNALRRAQYLLADPGGCELHDTTQPVLVGSHQQTGECSLKRAGGLDGTQGLDGADEGAVLGYWAAFPLRRTRVLGRSNPIDSIAKHKTE